MICLETKELRALIMGKFDFRKCLDCDGKGRVWVDGDNGEIVSGPDPKRDSDDFYKDQCEECDGLGGNLRINAE